MLELGFGDYRVAVQVGEHPGLYSHWIEHAMYQDVDDLNEDGRAMFIGVGKKREWYDLVIAFRTSPLDESGFNPGILIIPETETLFVGAGTVVRTYDLKDFRQKSSKGSSVGFWGWDRLDGLVIYSEELEVGAYTEDGAHLWSTFVEPPWNWKVADGRIELDVMGTVRFHDLRTGKEIS